MALELHRLALLLAHAPEEILQNAPETRPPGEHGWARLWFLKARKRSANKRLANQDDVLVIIILVLFIIDIC